MLKNYIKIDPKDKLAFNVNVLEDVRTLHVNSEMIGPDKKKVRAKDGTLLPYRKCPYQNLYNFIPFHELSEVEAFEKAHSCSFKRCGFCFPENMRGN